MRGNIFLSGAFAFFILFFSSCAQVGSPVGGAKDTTPPKIINSDPGNFSSGFNRKQIVLSFDEYVQIKDLNNQMIISPPLKNQPAVKVKGKSVVVELEEPLEANTTYTFDFGKSILDFTEGNPLDSSLFVVSTGSFIDSSSVSGKITDAFDLKPVKNVYVMLYENLNDSAPYKAIPNYLTRTREDGSYSIKHIRKGDYRLFTLKDENNNLLFDQPTERIGFYDEIINLDTSFTAELLMFEEAMKKQILKKSESPQYGKFVFTFSLPAENIKISPVFPDTTEIIKYYSLEKDTVIFWIPKLEGIDSIHFYVSDFDQIEESVAIAVGKKESLVTGGAKGRKNAVPLKLTGIANTNVSKPLPPHQKLEIEFNHPIKDFNHTLAWLTLSHDSISIDTIAFSAVSRQHRMIYSLNAELKEDSIYHFMAMPGAFRDIYNIENDTMSFSFKVMKKDALGSVSVKVELPENKHQYVIQLLSQEKVIKEDIISMNTSLSYSNLYAGGYSLRVVYDRNNNGKWDTGNYLENQQPEKIAFYPDAIIVKQNWDMELEWKVGEEKKVKADSN
jgi:hypothetical protein